MKVDPRLSITGIDPDGSNIVVYGTAELPDGARLRCAIWRGRWDHPEGTLDVDVSRLVGRFQCRFKSTSAWDGMVSSTVQLIADRAQPAQVQSVIGTTGERLAYADAIGQEYSVIVVVATVSALGGEVQRL